MTSPKILELDKLAECIDHLREQKSTKVILCHGVFDLLHLGHIKYFQESKSFGDLLIVTVTPDEYVRRGPGRPIFSAQQRAESIAALSVVDYVAINCWSTAVKTINMLKPDCYVKGPDYAEKRNDVTGNINLEEEAVKAQGGEIKTTTGITFSSTKLIKDNFNFMDDIQKAYLSKIKSKYSLDDFLSYLEMMGNLKVLLIGESIIDEYIPCNALGKAGKDPVMTFRKLKSEKHLGGVLAIANHLTEFCLSVNVLSCLGENREYEEYISNNLRPGITFDAISKLESPTIVKSRLIDLESNSKMLGIYDINDTNIGEEEEIKFLTMLESEINRSDVVIVADYGHGLLTEKLVNSIINKSKFLCVNTQLNSANIGFHTISKFHKADYVCMHEAELRHDFRSRDRGVEDLAKDLYHRLDAGVVTITQGNRGAICFDGGDTIEECPAFANKIVDKVGAGDALFGLTSLAITVGMPKDMSLIIGSMATLEVIASLGNSKSLSKNTLIKYLETIFK